MNATDFNLKKITQNWPKFGQKVPQFIWFIQKSNLLEPNEHNQR